MAATPSTFQANTKVARVSLTATANTNRDGTTGTYTTILTAGASGARIDRIEIIQPSGTAPAADKVSFFVGSNPPIIEQIMPAGATISGTVIGVKVPLQTPAGDMTPLVTLAASEVLKATTYVGTNCNWSIVVTYGDM
jgi:hypothetical protein